METNPDSGIGFLDEHRRTFFPRTQKQFFGFKILKFFDADANADAVSGIFLIQDLGRKNSDPGSGMNISDPQHCLVHSYYSHGIRVRIDSRRCPEIWIRIRAQFFFLWLPRKKFKVAK
jgi:hypothetical protein